MERFPEIDLFPRLTKVGKAIGWLLTGPHLLASHGDHTFEKNRGGGPALDREIFDHPQLPFPVIERPDAAQLDRTANRWDDMGRYYEA